jgi:hypothetical protein
MIQFRIVSVALRQSSEVNTVRYTYTGDETQTSKSIGAVWEEVEFAIVEQDKPSIQVANVSGDGYLVSSPAKVLINNPDLFGKFKVGDVIDFIPRTEPLKETSVSTAN